MIVLYHKSRKKSTKTGIGILGRVYSCGKFGRFWYNWRYTLVMSPIKIAGKRGKNKPHKNFVGFYLFLAAQETFYLWLMKDLRPTHEQNGQKQGKTGNFCKKRYFLGNFYTTYDRIHAQIFGIFTLPAPKFPAKITGNFSDHNRDFPPNIREFNKLTAKPIFTLFFG